MPRIKESILNCTIYLYSTKQDAQNGDRTGGSGFIVGVDSEKFEWAAHFYAVTNSHVIKEGKSSVIRVNATQGKPETIETDERDWYHHPNGDDLAIIPFQPDITKYRLLHVPSSMFISKQIMDDENLGAGDEVFMVGRFIGYDGKQKNEPIVRFGNLSITTPVPIEHPRGYNQESFLAEMRSLSGFSGSPVFIPLEISPLNMPRPSKAEYYESENELKLLGIDWGHRDLHEKVLQKNYDEYGKVSYEKVEDNLWYMANSGISHVVPAWKLGELLNIEKLVEMRKKDEEYLEKRCAELREPKDTDASLDVLKK